MDDLISRNEAVDAVNEYFTRINKLKRRGLNKGEKAISLDVIGAIKSLPSPQQWIPCSEVTGEGYPKEDGFYYVTERNYGFYLDADSKQNVTHTSHFFNGEFTYRFYDENHSNIVAWMPLPKPYEAERGES